MVDVHHLRKWVAVLVGREERPLRYWAEALLELDDLVELLECEVVRLQEVRRALSLGRALLVGAELQLPAFELPAAGLAASAVQDRFRASRAYAAAL